MAYFFALATRLEPSRSIDETQLQRFINVLLTTLNNLATETLFYLFSNH